MFPSCSEAFLSLRPNLSMSSSLLEENCFHLFSSVKFSCCLILCVVPLPLNEWAEAEEEEEEDDIDDGFVIL